MGYSRKGKVGFQSTHCLSGHPLYKTWKRMINRCENKNSKDYQDYGGRGIKICDEWRTDFVEFLYWSLKHGGEHGLSIERKDVNGNYCQENCCYIPLSEQPKNRTCTTRIEFDGEVHSISEWARIKCMSRSTLKERLKSKNFTVEEALNTPVNKNLARRNPYQPKGE